MKTALITYAVIMEMIIIAGGVLKLSRFEQANQILYIGFLLQVLFILLGLLAWHITTKNERRFNS